MRNKSHKILFFKFDRNSHYFLNYLSRFYQFQLFQVAFNAFYYHTP